MVAAVARVTRVLPAALLVLGDAGRVALRLLRAQLRCAGRVALPEEELDEAPVARGRDGRVLARKSRGHASVLRERDAEEAVQDRDPRALRLARVPALRRELLARENLIAGQAGRERVEEQHGRL